MEAVVGRSRPFFVIGLFSLSLLATVAPTGVADHTTAECQTAAGGVVYKEAGTQIDPVIPKNTYWSNWQFCNYRYVSTCDIYAADGTTVHIYRDTRFGLYIGIEYKGRYPIYEDDQAWYCGADSMFVNIKQPIGEPMLLTSE